MTEIFEVESLIEDLKDAAEEIAYEANTKPGNGLVFATKLIEARGLIDKATKKLAEAIEILKKEDHGHQNQI